MLEFFRKHTKTIAIPLFALIAVSFFFVGADQYMGAFSNQTILAEGDGMQITEAELLARVRQESESRPDLDSKIFDLPQTRLAILEQMVNDRLLALAAQQFQVYIGPQRQLDDLRQAPQWAQLRLSDGQLDQEAFTALARSQGLSPEGLLRKLADDMAMQEVYQSVTQSSFASRDNVQGVLNAFAQQREIQTVAFPLEQYLAKVQVNAAEEQAYYEQHPQDYQSQARADVEYLSLSLNGVRDAITPSEADVQAYYTQNVQSLQGPQERKASHILLLAQKTDSEEKHAQALQKAQDLLQQLQADPKKFDQLAKEHSQDPGTANNGGNLGYFARGAMVPAFEKAVFALQNPGDLSQIVQTDFGYHLIRLDDIKKTPAKTLEQLRPQIEDALRSGAANQIFAEKAEQLNTLTYEQPDSLSAAAKALGLTVEKVDKLPLNGSTTQADNGSVLENPDFLQAVITNAQNNLGKNSPVIDLGDQAVAVVRVLHYDPVQLLPLDQVQARVQTAVRIEKAQALAKAAGQAALEQAQKDSETPFDWSQPTLLSRIEPNTTIPNPVAVKVWSLPTQNLPSVLGVDVAGQGYWLVKMLKLSSATLDSEQSEALGQQYQTALRTAQERAYLDWLRAHFAVEVFRQNIR